MYSTVVRVYAQCIVAGLQRIHRCMVSSERSSQGSSLDSMGCSIKAGLELALSTPCTTAYTQSHMHTAHSHTHSRFTFTIHIHTHSHTLYICTHIPEISTGMLEDYVSGTKDGQTSLPAQSPTHPEHKMFERERETTQPHNTLYASRGQNTDKRHPHIYLRKRSEILCDLLQSMVILSEHLTKPWEAGVLAASTHIMCHVEKSRYGPGVYTHTHQKLQNDGHFHYSNMAM